MITAPLSGQVLQYRGAKEELQRVLAPKGTPVEGCWLIPQLCLLPAHAVPQFTPTFDFEAVKQGPVQLVDLPLSAPVWCNNTEGSGAPGAQGPSGEA